MNRTRTPIAVLPFLLFLSSCGPEKPASEGNDSTQASGTPPAVSYVVTPAYYDTLSKNPAPLANGLSSVNALLTAVLEGVRRNDTTSLKNLLITRDEYLAIIYPELGKHWAGARDMRREIKEALWINHAGNAMKGLRRALRDLGGRELKLEKVEFADGTKEYASYTVYEGTIVTVKDREGREHKIGAIGSIVEKDGVFKLLSYRDSDPE